MSDHYTASNENYFISTDASKLDIDIIYHYLSEESYWAKDIPRAVVEKSIINSLCFGLYYNNEQALPAGRQVGFARLITDKATFAFLADVFILPQYRGKGLSKWLLQTIHAHPKLQGLRRWLLGTKDAHGLYEQFGWTRFTEEASNRFMQKHNPDVYRKVE
jgi:GNAT superfamily N-acetyltransferase